MTLHRGGQLFQAQPRTLEGLLELTQYPSRALNFASPRPPPCPTPSLCGAVELTTYQILVFVPH